jgi:hypothetical protein
MKKTLLAGLMIAGLSVVAQTPRLSLYEEFTGENCGPCAATNPGLNTLLSSTTNTPLIVAIKWEVPIPSAPTPTWSLYKTNQSEIDWRYQSSGSGGYGYIPQVTYAPFGKIDGQSQAVFGASGTNVDHPALMSNGIIATAHTYTSAFSITMTRAWDPTFSSVNLTVSIQATAPFTALGPLVFRTVMIEREIEFQTAPGTNGEKIFHNAARKSFPSIQAGTPMAGSWIVGQTQTFTLNCPLPSYIHDKSEVAFVGFIQDDVSQKVAQAVLADKTSLTNDAKAEAIANFPAITCGASIIPTVTVKNNGSNVITGFDITPYLNGTPGTLFNWTGSLAVGASTTFALPSIAIAQGVNTFSYNISSVVGTDNNLLNNGISKTFIGIANYQGTPVAEGFVSTTFPPTNWATYNNYAGTTWERVTGPTIGGFAASTECTKLNFYNGVPTGSVNDLLLPAMSFTGNAVPTMSFDVAYAQYDGTETDMLEVKASKDCGATWTTLYAKAGSTLSTNPAVGNNVIFTPSTAGQWRKEVITFPTSFMNSNIIVKFVGTSDFGNNLYLDNINLASCNNQTITVTSSKPAICKGESVKLSGGGATTFTWSSAQIQPASLPTQL